MARCSDCGRQAPVVPTKNPLIFICRECLEYDTSPVERNFGDPIQEESNSRFSMRLVGVEVETGEGATEFSFMRDYFKSCKSWAYKEDGSLNGGGMELVSPPVGGGAIPKEIRKVYRLLAKHQVDMKDDSAGTHIHVDMRDVYDNIRRNPVARSNFKKWGDQLVNVVKRLVDEDRAENCYCSDGFGFRYTSDRSTLEFLNVNEYGDGAVAIRKNTLEFRIWSVTDKAEVTLARAEFSQKVVEYLNTATTQASFDAWGEACKMFRSKVDFKPLARLLGLSKATVKELKGIGETRSMQILEAALDNAE